MPSAVPSARSRRTKAWVEPAVEPHVEDVENLLVGLRVVVVPEEARLGAGLVPGIRALGLEGVEDAGVDRGIAQEEVRVARRRPLLHEARKRHTPRALARQDPVGPRFHHRAQAVLARDRRELDQLVDRGQRAFADRLAMRVLAILQVHVDGREPLRAVQADDGRLGAPGMRVGDRDALAGQQLAHLNQLVDHHLVGVPRFAVLADYPLAAEEGQVGAERRVVEDVVRHLEAVLAPDLVVIVAVAGGRVDEARARVVGDMVTREQPHVEVPLAIGLFRAAQGMGAAERGKLVGRHVAQAAVHGMIQPHGRKRLFGQRVGQKVAVPDPRPAFRGAAGDLVEAVGDLGAEADRPVLRQGPGGRGPDDDLSVRERHRLPQLPSAPRLTAGEALRCAFTSRGTAPKPHPSGGRGTPPPPRPARSSPPATTSPVSSPGRASRSSGRP
jgi:hypothetical protein